MPLEQELNDGHQYIGVSLYGDTVKFFLDALAFYQSALEKDIEALRADPDLRLLVDVEDAASPMRRELELAARATAWLSEPWDKDIHGFGVAVTISHGSVRFLKSVGLAYLRHLRAVRDAVGTRISSEAVLADLDRRLGQLAEKVEMGVFGNATAKPILISDIASAPKIGQDLEGAGKLAPPPVVLATIEILDDELNARCSDLFELFSERNQSDRFDTVIMEATKILENRLRNRANLDSSLDGVQLVAAALSGANAPLKLSSHGGEQRRHTCFFAEYSG